jgi:hypothetical protein
MKWEIIIANWGNEYNPPTLEQEKLFEKIKSCPFETPIVDDLLKKYGWNKYKNYPIYWTSSDNSLDKRYIPIETDYIIMLPLGVDDYSFEEALLQVFKDKEEKILHSIFNNSFQEYRNDLSNDILEEYSVFYLKNKIRKEIL